MYIAVTRQGMGTTAFMSQGIWSPDIWNSLPEKIKSTDSIYELKNFLKGWYGCRCYLCVG